MTMAVPTTVDEVVGLLADHPTATLLAGGTDLMVEINDGYRRPDDMVIALNRVADLRAWRHDRERGTVTVGAGVTYTELMAEPLATLLPALAEASRTVGSPQIRNAGTLGGNLGTCSPAGDGLPVLSALDADVLVVSQHGERTVSVHDLMVGVKRTSLEPGELIAEITLPVRRGGQGYAKVGVRNAMVIAIASACLVADEDAQTVSLSLGSVGPTIIRCTDAEESLSSSVDWAARRVDTEALRRFGDLASLASSPITDHRSSAEYRRHAVGVLSRRLARRAFAEEAVR
jgi:CO/xanthine dehydrogenase FAD-binding subunit